jgi:hypothetical protein
MQTVRTLGIEALNGIMQGLPFHASQPGGLSSSQTLERIGDSEQPQGSPGIPLAGRPYAQIGRRVVQTDREPGHDDLHQQRPRSAMNHATHLIANPSQQFTGRV